MNEGYMEKEKKEIMAAGRVNEILRIKKGPHPR